MVINPFNIRNTGKHIGDIVFWKVEAVLASVQEVLSAAVKAGMEPTVALPEPAAPVVAFRRACQKPVPWGWLVRPISTRGDRVSYGLVREVRDPATQRVKHTQVAHLEYTVPLDVMEDPVVDYDHQDADEAQDIVNSISEEYYTKVGRVTTDEVIEWLVAQTSAWAGFPLRPQGGLYFIPYQSAEAARKAATFIAAMPAKAAELYLMPQYDAEEALAAARAAAQDHLETELDALGRDLDRYIGEYADATRSSTVERRLEQYNELRARIRLYEGTLQVMLDEQHARLNALTEAAKEWLNLRK